MGRSLPKYKILSFLLIGVITLTLGTHKGFCIPTDNLHEKYISYFKEVYNTMEKNYYRPVAQEEYNRFLNVFDKEIYPTVKNAKKLNNYILWRSAAKLVDFLKDPKDDFSRFLPPRYAKKFEHEVLGEKIDLGIEGVLTSKGYDVSHVEPRSDAFVKGLRTGDVILRIDNKNVRRLTEKKIKELLTPPKGSLVRLRFRNHTDGKIKTIQVKSQQYFKQTVFLVPTHVPGIFCLSIQRFNRKTAEDLFRFLQFIENKKNDGLIIDLRGNPGGPPLAAREISAFFLEPNENFAYFQKRGEAKAWLRVPAIPSKYRYQGPMAILVNKKSGSASELFSGVLQKKGRAQLFGEKTAGRVLLKSMFYLSDGSMMALVTGRGHFPDGSLFPYTGLIPDHYLKSATDNTIQKVAYYLLLGKKSLGKGAK